MNEETIVKTIHAHVGFLGLGAMGLPMALNIRARLAPGYDLCVFDVNASAVAAAVAQGAVAVDTPAVMGARCDIVVTMLPNDKVLKHVVTHPETGLLSGGDTSVKKGLVHIGCSTVHPDTSRDMAKLHTTQGGAYIGAPVFARADGVAQRAASLVVGGDPTTIASVRPVLDAMSQGIYLFGEGDAGAGNVVKLCGNFMIATAIESCAEACSLAEGSGLDRVAVMDMLTSTIFDCLIYKGYGMRTAHRQHIPGQPLVGPGFGLALGLKDITLARDVAAQVQTPLPLASLLQDRFLASAAKGRSALDWSAVALLASEDAGRDVTAWLPGGDEAAAAGDPTAPV
jgi:3-hydroxyisobutyrate dehydrogenase-like beta-hydroxyacid dehydrogenase